MTWSTALADLRRYLADNDNDKLRYRKPCIGLIDGVNTIFKTLEYRRVTDFESPGASEGVFVDGAPVTVVSDNQNIGEFELQVAPTGTQMVTASYFVKWFTDDELSEFLQHGSSYCSIGEDYAQVPPALKSAVLNYGASEAYQRLAMRWSDTMSDVYKLQDNKDDDETPARVFSEMAKTKLEAAEKIRNDYFERQGRQKQPIFGSAGGLPNNGRVVPNR